MKKSFLLLLLGSGLIACGGGGLQSVGPPEELKHFPLDSLNEIRATTGVTFDPAVSTDNGGSIRVDAAGPLTVPLFEVTDVNYDNCILNYQANLQSANLDGQAYLEMWVRIPGKGEFFSRSVDRPLTGTMSWMTVSSPFFLESGQGPDLLRLNLVVQGTGQVWIDDIRLQRQELPAHR